MTSLQDNYFPTTRAAVLKTTFTAGRNVRAYIGEKGGQCFGLKGNSRYMKF